MICLTIRRAVWVWVLAFMTAGCSVFRPAKQAIRIETTPSGVPVFVDGQDRGPSPVTIELQRNQSHKIMASTQGAVYTRELNPKLSAAGTLDIIGAAVVLVPGVGLLAPGAYDLDMMNVILHLDEKPPTGATAPRPSDGH